MAVLIEGMLGLGDVIRQRAIVRYWLSQQEEVFVKTPWPCVYEDLPVHCLPVPTGLRTQARNAKREEQRYSNARPFGNVRKIKIWYSHSGIRQTGSFMKATLLETKTPPDCMDYSMPVPIEWGTRQVWDIPTHKPIMVLRPLVSRAEWGGCDARNPDPGAYRALYESIRQRFFVVSLADLEPGKEWIYGPPLEADLCFHRGELSFQEMAWLTQRAALMFASPGFGCILASAVGTPAVMVAGGRENAGFYVADALAPFLPVDPIVPDDCFVDACQHSKAVDLGVQIPRLKEFCDACLRDTKTVSQPAETGPEGSADALHTSGRVGGDCGADALGQAQAGS